MAVSAFLNGTIEKHNLLASRGLAYGDGLFETIAYRDGVLRLWDRHMERLLTGCERLGLEAPPLPTLKSEALELLGGRSQAVVKILLARTTAHRGYSPIPSTGVDRIVQAFDWPDINHTWQRNGVKIGLCEMSISENPMLAGIKHLNKLEQVIAAKEVVNNSWDEGLMCTADGRVICGTKSNIFMTQGDTILTPELSTCGVAGVMRANIMAIAEEHGYKMALTNLSITELREAEGMFISNALIGLVPVTEFCILGDAQSKSVVFKKQEMIESLQKLLD